MNEESIFAAAVDKPCEERAAYLDEACAGDESLRARVEALLEAHDNPDSFLDSRVSEFDATSDQSPVTERPGTRIGPYKLLQQIGEGGFGVVYMAEQQQPVRRVALKIIKPGMDTKQVIARFEAERQALALMDHPNIARVLDAGSTESGRPYFVMDLVKGVPITEYCDKNELSTDERLELFVEVCRAVQHAHQKGVIHRDIKPSNVLVTLHDGTPVPKIIDFGVSKAINQQLTEKTLFTTFGQMVGTPQYMSPEQAEMSGLDVDTRSDVYSLGVLLYELLTGSTPLEGERLRTAGYAEMQRIIREEEPPRPSVRLSTDGEQLTVIARHRSVDPRRLQQLVRGELDWIVMKSLEKDRTRRYESPLALVADVKRFLTGEAVEACPPSITYRIRKFVRRNWLLVATALAVSLALVLGTLGTSIGMLFAQHAAKRADKERIRAEEEAQRADRTAEHYRLQAYISGMNAARQSWEENDLPRTVELLERQVPRFSQKDLRKWEWYYLRHLCDRSDCARLEIAWPGNSAHSVSVSDDGVIAVAYHDSVVLYDMEELDEIARYPTKPWNDIKDEAASHMPPYFAFPFVAISKDGQLLAYADSENPELLVVRHRETANVQTFHEHEFAVRTASFSPNGKLLVSGGHNGKVIIWDTGAGQTVDQHREHSQAVWSVSFSPTGKFVASGGADNKVMLWDLETGNITSLEGHFTTPSTVDGVLSVTFSDDDSLLASGGADRTVRIWSVQEKRLVRTLVGHTDEVRSVAFSPDGKTVASGSRDHSVRLWDTRSGQVRGVIRGGPGCLDHGLGFVR